MVGAALASLVACCAFAREPQLAELRSYSLPGCTLLAPDPALAQDVATQVALIEPVMAVVLNKQAAAVAAPTTVLMVRGADLDRYVGNENLAGLEILPRSFRNYLLLRSDGSRDLQRASVYHQFAHLFLRTQYREEFPWWFDEGFALFMETTRFEGADAVVGNARFGFRDGPRKSDDLLEQFRKEERSMEPNPNSQGRSVPEWTSIETVLRYRGGAPGETGEGLYLMRRQSWAMVHRALVGEPAFGTQVFAYLQAVNQFMPIDEAVQKSFGMPTADLDKGLRAYAARQRFKTERKAFAAPAGISVGSGQPVNEGEALVIFATMLLDDGAARNVEEVIAAAARIAPGSAEVDALRMRLAALNQDAAGFERLLAAMESRKTEPAAARGAGLALFEWMAREDANLSKTRYAVARAPERALQLLDRALQAKPDDAEAAWAFTMLAAATNTQLDPALQRLKFVSERTPQNADLAMAAAHLHEARNEAAAMLEQLANTARFSRSIEQRRWALKNIELAEASQKSTP